MGRRKRTINSASSDIVFQFINEIIFSPNKLFYLIIINDRARMNNWIYLFWKIFKQLMKDNAILMMKLIK